MIAALVVIRITLQFLVQAIGVIVLRIRRPDLPRPFRMWLYPLPALLASVGFIFVLVSPHQLVETGSLCVGHPYYRHCHLHGASVAKSGMAVWSGPVARGNATH